MLRKLILICAGIAVVGAAVPGYAVTPRSDSYSFEYVVTGMGGGVSSSADYTLVAYMDQTGSAGSASSADYSIAPAIGAADPRGASAENWMLY